MEIRMKDLLFVLLSHASKYPQMRPQDAALLIYENEYGPGKLAGDGAESRLRLRSMYERARKCAVDFNEAGLINKKFQKESLNDLSGRCRREIGCGSGVITEDIGNGYVRVYLESIPAEMYGSFEDAYIASMEESKGSHYFLTPKLYELIDLKLQGNFEFSMEELEDFLMEYESLDYPKPEHSRKYIINYEDNYCVIAEKLLSDILE